ncbi:hypothetical protein EC988_003350 [Linderina pennispora]|nr:hypothetical protein EC988_003350 [Linderina pennispora]
MKIAIVSFTSLASLAMCQNMGFPGFYPSSGGFYPASGSFYPASGASMTVPTTYPSGFANLAPYVDLSRLTRATPDHPVMTAGIYNPETQKFMPMSADVMQSGGIYYIPVCTAESVTGGVGVQDSASCQYAVVMSPMPEEVAMVRFRMMRAMVEGAPQVPEPVAMPEWVIGPLPGAGARPATAPKAA